MRRTNRPMVLSLMLATLGGLAAFMALSANTAQPIEVETVSVVVATRPLTVGQRIGASDIALREVPAAAASVDAVRALAEADGRYVVMPLLQGEALVLPKLSDRTPGSSLAALIPPGHVAVSVAVSDVVSTGGFIAPGDRVDVLGVVTRETHDRAEVVIQNVTVLAVASAVIGSGDAPPSGGATRANPRSLDATVTLAVTVDEARRLVQVDENGTLRLALRARPADDSVVQRSP